MKNLAKNAKRFRLDKGLTQEMLASRAGVTRGYISLLEGGKKQPALSTLSKIADVLGVGLGEFFDGDPAGSHFLHIRKSEFDTPVRKNPISIYSYKLLAASVKEKKMDPFLLRIDPGEQKTKAEHYHTGEEFILVLKGRLKFIFGDEEFFLDEGDAAYLDSSVVHTALAVGKKPVYLLCITTK